MADESMSDKVDQILLTSVDPSLIIECRINGSDIKPGHVVTNYGESNEKDIDLCGAGEPPLGVVLDHVNDDADPADPGKDQLDIDTVYADNSVARVAVIGSGAKLAVFRAGQTTTTTIYKGNRAVAAASGTVSLPTFSTTTAELNNDVNGFVGRFLSYTTGGSDVEIVAVVV